MSPAAKGGAVVWTRDDAMRALCDANAGRAAFYRVLAGYFYQELKEDDLEALRARDLLAGVGRDRCATA